MKATSVLLIEIARTNGVSFAAALKRKYQVRIAESGKQALAMVKESRPDVVVLDAVSLRTSGNRIVERLRALHDELPIIHIRPDRAGSESAADVQLALPFTPRKLTNRIERLVAANQADRRRSNSFASDVQHPAQAAAPAEKKMKRELAGLMELLKQNPHATPKLVALMELFIQNPNVTLERRQIMQTVWDTDYMGDTRTLDVHIHWIRKAIEPDPRKPQYIRTERGVGYKLSLSEDGASASKAN